MALLSRPRRAVLAVAIPLLVGVLPGVLPGHPGTTAGAASDAGAASEAGAASAAGAAYQARAGALLAAPAAIPEANTTLQRLLSNITNAPAGSTIRIVAFSLNLPSVADTLIAAHARGVGVQLVLNGHNRRFPAARALAAVLGTDRAQRSYVVFTRRSARGGDLTGELHQKTWMFSATGASEKVVMVGSMNLTEYGTTSQYSDTYSFVGREDVWTTFNTVFEQQVLDQPVPMAPVRQRLGSDRVWFGPGFTATDDPVAEVLARIDPRGAQIRIGAFAWWDERGERLARQVLALRDAGAGVRILTGIHVSSRVKRILRRGDQPFFRGGFADGQNIHFKMVLVRDRQRDKRYLLTGSDNWSDASYLKDDLDIVIALSARQYRRYVRFFESIVDRSEAEYPVGSVLGDQRA